jgi:hypothetical protein
MKQSPENQTVDNAIHEIQVMADNLDSTDTTKLTSGLWDLDAV